MLHRLARPPLTDRRVGSAGLAHAGFPREPTRAGSIVAPGGAAGPRLNRTLPCHVSRVLNQYGHRQHLSGLDGLRGDGFGPQDDGGRHVDLQRRFIATAIRRFGGDVDSSLPGTWSDAGVQESRPVSASIITPVGEMSATRYRVCLRKVGIVHGHGHGQRLARLDRLRGMAGASAAGDGRRFNHGRLLNWLLGEQGRLRFGYGRLVHRWQRLEHRPGSRPGQGDRKTTPTTQRK